MKYAWLTLKHKWYVFLAGIRLKLPLWRLLVHDLSKFTKAELPHYNRQFFGDKGDPEGFAVAWLHHQNANAHHWEYHITRSDHSHGGSGDDCLPMPDVYVREMIADWMGASRAYTGSWIMVKWLRANLDRIKIHRLTKRRLIFHLVQLGYLWVGEW